MIKSVQVQNLTIDNDAPFALFGGMNVLESRDLAMKICEHYVKVTEKLGIPYVFKASFDKANRSSDSGKRGYGFENTMSDFLLMKRTEPDLKILTDVHRETHIDLTEEFHGDAIDVYQIPAFLSRQTDLIKRACKTDKIVFRFPHSRPTSNNPIAAWLSYAS